MLDSVSTAEFCEGGLVSMDWMELYSLVGQYLVWLAVLTDAFFQ